MDHLGIFGSCPPLPVHIWYCFLSCTPLTFFILSLFIIISSLACLNLLFIFTQLAIRIFYRLLSSVASFFLSYLYPPLLILLFITTLIFFPQPCNSSPLASLLHLSPSFSPLPGLPTTQNFPPAAPSLGSTYYPFTCIIPSPVTRLPSL